MSTKTVTMTGPAGIQDVQWVQIQPIGSGLINARIYCVATSATGEAKGAEFQIVGMSVNASTTLFSVVNTLIAGWNTANGY